MYGDLKRNAWMTDAPLDTDRQAHLVDRHFARSFPIRLADRSQGHRLTWCARHAVILLIEYAEEGPDASGPPIERFQWWTGQGLSHHYWRASKRCVQH